MSMFFVSHILYINILYRGKWKIEKNDGKKGIKIYLFESMLYYN